MTTYANSTRVSGLLLSTFILSACPIGYDTIGGTSDGQTDTTAATDTTDDEGTSGDGDGDTTGDGDGDGDTTGDGDGDTVGDGDGDTTGDGDGDTGGLPPAAPMMFELTLAQVKQFEFSWAAADGAEYYQLLESADLGEPYVQVGDDVLGLATSLTVPLHFRLNASYLLRACNDQGCTDSNALDVEGPLVEAIGYFKASNTDAGDGFGSSVALSGDGNTLAVGAFEDSSAMGIGGNQADDSAPGSGAVYVFVRDDQDAWSQQAYVKASNTDADDRFRLVALSADGSTLAVGDEGDFGRNSGAVYVFVRDDQSAWSQKTYVKASNTFNYQYFSTVALSDDGNTLAVGAGNEHGSAMGIGGDQQFPNLSEFFSSGAVYVY